MYGWIPHLGLKQNIELNIMDMKLNAIVRKANRETRVYSSSSASSGGAQKPKEENAANVNTSKVDENNKSEEKKNENVTAETSNKEEAVKEPKVEEKKTEEKKESKKEKKKAEQNKKAEAEAPVEPAGAEKINEDKRSSQPVNSNVEAAMGCQPSANPYADFKEQQSGFTPNFNGFVADDKTAKGFNVGDIMNNVKSVFNGIPNINIPQSNPNQQAQQQPVNQNAQMPFMPQIPPEMMMYFWQMQNAQAQQPPVAPQQPVQQEQTVYVPNVQTVAPPATQEQVIYTPPIQTVEEPEDDKVKVSINIDETPSLNKKVKYPGPIQEVTNPPEEELVFENKFDNSELIAKFPILKNIQDVANDNKVHAKFTESATTGIILVDSYDQNRRLDIRCFILDMGMIIDNRVKVYPFNKEMIGDSLNFELSHAFTATIRDNSDPKKKGAKQKFNYALFDIIFKGGINSLADQQGMFSAELMKANRYVDMISMLKYVRNKQQREIVRKNIINLSNTGFFENLRMQANDYEIRFKVTYVDKDNTIKLENGAPVNYGRDAFSKIPITITIKADGSATMNAPGGVLAS